MSSLRVPWPAWENENFWQGKQNAAILFTEYSSHSHLSYHPETKQRVRDPNTVDGNVRSSTCIGLFSPKSCPSDSVEPDWDLAALVTSCCCSTWIDLLGLLLPSCSSELVNQRLKSNTLLSFTSRSNYSDQRWSPRGRLWPQGRPRFEVLGFGLEGQVLGLGLEASSPRKLACPRLEDSSIFWIVKILWSAWKIFWKTYFCGDRLENFCKDPFFFLRSPEKFLWRPFFFFWENTCACLLGLGFEHFCPWPRKCLSSERLSLALASDFFVSLALASSLVSSTPPLIVTLVSSVQKFIVSFQDRPLSWSLCRTVCILHNQHTNQLYDEDKCLCDVASHAWLLQSYVQAGPSQLNSGSKIYHSSVQWLLQFDDWHVFLFWLNLLRFSFPCNRSYAEATKHSPEVGGPSYQSRGAWPPLPPALLPRNHRNVQTQAEPYEHNHN